MGEIPLTSSPKKEIGLRYYYGNSYLLLAIRTTFRIREITTRTMRTVRSE